MTLKKMMLLASMALAVVAFVAPASASAASTHWTDNHEVVGNEVDITAPFEGFLQFTVAPPFVPVHSTFGCKVTVKVTVTSPTDAEITEFAPTTTECSGTGVFTGCQLKVDEANTPWEVLNNHTDLDVDMPNTEEDVTIFNEYHSCAAGALPASHLEFPSITVTPTLGENGTIDHLAIEGVATGTGAKASGSVTPEPENDPDPTLGLVTVG